MHPDGEILGPAVGVLDQQNGGLEHPGDAARAHRRAPHDDVGRREVVEKPRGVRSVLRGHRDVHDAPRTVERLPRSMFGFTSRIARFSQGYRVLLSIDTHKLQRSVLIPSLFAYSLTLSSFGLIYCARLGF